MSSNEKTHDKAKAEFLKHPVTKPSVPGLNRAPTFEDNQAAADAAADKAAARAAKPAPAGKRS